MPTVADPAAPHRVHAALGVPFRCLPLGTASVAVSMLAMVAPALSSRLPSAASHEWLEAEASTRRFARLIRPAGIDAPTAVAMVFASKTPPAEVERVARSTTQLAEAGVPVPALYRIEPEQRLIVQEDLGSIALADAKTHGVDLRAAYSEAMAILKRIEQAAVDTSPAPPLDAVRMRRELAQFASGAVPGSGPELEADLDAVVEACAALPVALCHRDYHSRNLLVLDGRVRVIDHQDAMAAPLPYDRVSLAYDPYVELAEQTRDVIAATARPALEAWAAEDPDENDIERAIGWVAVQRLAKAIGTFTFKGGKWTTVIPPAARQARRLIAKHRLSVPVLDMALAPLSIGGALR